MLSQGIPHFIGPSMARPLSIYCLKRKEHQLCPLKLITQHKFAFKKITKKITIEIEISALIHLKKIDSHIFTSELWTTDYDP